MLCITYRFCFQGCVFLYISLNSAINNHGFLLLGGEIFVLFSSIQLKLCLIFINRLSLLELWCSPFQILKIG